MEGQGFQFQHLQGVEGVYSCEKCDRLAETFYTVWKIPKERKREKMKENFERNRNASSRLGEESICSWHVQDQGQHPGGGWEGSPVSPQSPENPHLCSWWVLLVGSLVFCIPAELALSHSAGNKTSPDFPVFHLSHSAYFPHVPFQSIQNALSQLH